MSNVRRAWRRLSPGGRTRMKTRILHTKTSPEGNFSLILVPTEETQTSASGPSKWTRATPPLTEFWSPCQASFSGGGREQVKSWTWPLSSPGFPTEKGNTSLEMNHVTLVSRSCSDPEVDTSEVEKIKLSPGKCKLSMVLDQFLNYCRNVRRCRWRRRRWHENILRDRGRGTFSSHNLDLISAQQRFNIIYNVKRKYMFPLIEDDYYIEKNFSISSFWENKPILTFYILRVTFSTYFQADRVFPSW